MRRRLRQAWPLSAVAAPGILPAVTLLAAGQKRFGRPQTGMALATDPTPRPPPPGQPFYDRIPPDSGVAMSERTRTIRTYARCGLANFGRTRIQIRSIVGINPERLPKNGGAANTL